jgi:hypothetical protein
MQYLQYETLAVGDLSEYCKYCLSGLDGVVQDLERIKLDGVMFKVLQMGN